MHILFKKVLSKKIIFKIISRIKKLKIDNNDVRHFSKKGKYFFTSFKGKILLKNILNEVLKNTTILDAYNIPIVQHAFVLVKTESGKKTPFHQDRPFWLKIENEPSSMITLWFSLHKINNKNGSLLVEKVNESEDIYSLNRKQKLFEHIKKNEDNGFDYFIQKGLKIDDFKDYSMEAGDMISFDAYEIHGSNDNISQKPRYSFKIVLIEKDKILEKGNYLVDVKNLLKYPTGLYLILRKLNFIS